MRVEVDGAKEGWAGGVPGVEDVTDGGGGLILALSEDADDQVVLDAARRAGRVRRFGAVRPSLAEIFREAVA